MFHKIMCPVDLTHTDALTKALEVTADLARHYECGVVFVGVTSALPGKLAHSPDEYRQRLQDFAQAQAARHGITAEGHMALAHDPRTEIESALEGALRDTGADLVVMASHVPNALDYIWPSNGGRLAEHAACSVMVVRG